MSRYELDDLESDEAYQAFVERKAMLEAIVKRLNERDGLPEAAEAVRKRIEIYMPNGQGTAERPGLLRLFGPQHHLDAERHNQQADEERDANGGQDLFGGGAETGGRTRKGRGKKTQLADGTPAEEAHPAALGEPTEPAPSEEPPVIDPIDTALGQLDEYANSLLQHDGRIEETIYQASAVPVMDLLMIINPALDRELLTWQVNDELAHGDENAHELGWLIQRHVSAIREAREKPIRRDDGDFPGDDTPDYTIVPDPALETLEENAGTPPLTFAGPAPDDSPPPGTPDTPTRGRGKKRKT